MATRKVLLEEDRTALKPENYIQGESVNIGIGRDRLLRFEYGAFYEEDFKLLDENGTEIDRDKYTFHDLYEEATRNSGKAVWNCLVVTDPAVPEKLVGYYHAYGGRFAVNARILVEWLNEKLNTAVDPIEFVDLIDRPRAWTPKYHKHLWDEVYGWSYFKKPLDHIENAIELDKSFFYNMLIKDIQRKLKEANDRAMQLANFYATKAVSDATINISKEKLGIHLLANFYTADPAEMRKIAKEDFNTATILEDKYINKKGLIAFTEILNQRSVKISETNLGTKEVFIRESKRGALIGLGNAGIATFESKDELVKNGNFYEENVYPKNYPAKDRFTVLRVTHNLQDHGGVFLGFNNTTGEMFSGTLKDDLCFMRIKWYKFYSELTYNSIKEALAEHVKATNNPHKLTKKQVKLENVKNLPVATIDEIMKGDPIDAYLTLDGLQMFMAKHLLDLKPEFKEDGTLNKDSDLFNKPNIIFTPCDKKVPDNWPPEGQLLKTYCDGTDRFQRLADGKGGFTDKVLELNSDDCKFFEIRPQGEVLYKVCKEKDQWTVVADGRGGTTEVLSAVNSQECGFVPPPEAGTVLGEECRGTDKVRKYADGNGGITTSIVEANSVECGFTTTTTTTTAPRGKKIMLYSTHRKIEKGTVETFTAHFTNFEPNTTVGFNLQQREPMGTVFDGKFKEWHDALDGSVQIDSSGSGQWQQTVEDDGSTVPRGTVWNNRIQDTDGTISNSIVRDFVGSGDGDTGVQPPTLPPVTDPPVNIKPQLSIEPSSDWRVNALNLSPTFTFNLTGGAPNTNYYFRFMHRRHPPMQGIDDKWNLIEVWNGNLTTNGAGTAKYFGSHNTIYAHLNNHAGGAYDTIQIFNYNKAWLELEDGTKSAEIIVINQVNDQTG
jgi:hypothetical protein